MGLKKSIELDNGIITNYHRIVSINNITNVQTNIEVASYTTKEKREEEKISIEKNKGINIFINTNYYNVPYEENYSIEQAYEYLKTLDKFNEAEDC